MPLHPDLQIGIVDARVLDARGRVVRDWTRFYNGRTYEGVNAGLEVLYRAGAQVTQWYAGLISNAGYTGISVNDTMASHAGWAEATLYSGSRPAWSPAAASAGVVAPAAALSVTCNDAAGMSVRGVFLSSVAAKGGTSGVLNSTAVLPAAFAVANGQTFQFRYRIQTIPG